MREGVTLYHKEEACLFLVSLRESGKSVPDAAPEDGQSLSVTAKRDRPDEPSDLLPDEPAR